MERDMITGCPVTPVLAPAVYTTDQTGTYVNHRALGATKFDVVVASSLMNFDTSNKLELILWEADDVNGSGAAAVAQKDIVVSPNGPEVAPATSGIFKAVTAILTAKKTYRVGYCGQKPFVTVRCEFTGTIGTGIGLAITATQCRTRFAGRQPIGGFAETD